MWILSDLYHSGMHCQQDTDEQPWNAGVFVLSDRSFSAPFGPMCFIFPLAVAPQIQKKYKKKLVLDVSAAGSMATETYPSEDQIRN